MKLFTLKEANELLPVVEPKLRSICSLYEKINELRDEATSAAESSKFGGGMVGGTVYVNNLYQVGKLTTELSELGIEVKDHARGLIDFPSMKNGRVVYLCWQFGDGPEIKWWHELDAGFAGRQEL
jgi:hypothetical protein